MIMDASMTRRSLLQLLVGLTACGLPRTVHALAKLGTPTAPDPLAVSLAYFFIYSKSAKTIGLEYLRCRPKEADVRLLTEMICSRRPERRTELIKADMGKRREALLLLQRQDFERG